MVVLPVPEVLTEAETLPALGVLTEAEALPGISLPGVALTRVPARPSQPGLP